MARVLLLRAPEDARHTAALLAARGHEALALPVQEVRLLDAAPLPGPFAGFIVTSGHAVGWLARHHAGTVAPVLAVGTRTAERLAGAGFADVLAGTGRAENLIALAATLANAQHRPFLYAAGRVRLPALEAGFAEKGMPIEVAEVYNMVSRAISPRDLGTVLGNRPPDAVLILSRRQAELFSRWADAVPAMLPADIVHLCLSPPVAAALPFARQSHARIASHPDIPHLLEFLA